MTSNVTPLRRRRERGEYAWGEDAWERAVVLRKDIAAIQALSGRGGEPSLGMMLRLPRGLQVEVCGGGFSDGTVKVRAENEFFFVLLGNVIP